MIRSTIKGLLFLIFFSKTWLFLMRPGSETPVSLDDDFIDKRPPVWEALTYVITTSMEERNIKNIVNACKASGYSIKLLDRIFIYELMPAISYYEDEWTAEYFIYVGYDISWLKKIVPLYTRYRWITEDSRISWIKKFARKYQWYHYAKNWEKVTVRLKAEGIPESESKIAG